jgi:electron transfer flavoprotein alpha subunit
MIVVLVETDNTGLATEVSLETITFARDLATQGGGVPIDVAVIGHPSPDLTAQLGAHGVREIHAATDADAFGSYSAAAWAAAVQAVQKATGAVVVTAAGSPRGNEVLAHVGARMGVAMAANVVKFGGLAPFVVTRQVVGGAALEEMQLHDRPAVFSVAGHAVEPSPAATATSPPVVSIVADLAPADLVARVVSTIPRPPDQSGSLKSARVVVGAGRGAGGADGFKGVIELAELLGGSLGVSRVVTSLGWRPHHEQVGQTGSRISPELYIPCGISGAIQHWAGCASSKVILAINTDPEAPMMTKATYAVVGDMHEVVPAINEELKARRP